MNLADPDFYPGPPFVKNDMAGVTRGPRSRPAAAGRAGVTRAARVPPNAPGGASADERTGRICGIIGASPPRAAGAKGALVLGIPVRVRNRILALLAATLLAAVPLARGTETAKAEAGQTALEAETQEKLDVIFTKYQTLGACVCVIENGRVAHTFCYGTLSPDGPAVTADTLFRVGSISKMVTAMGVMRLAETGAVTLDGDLSTLLGVTVRNPVYPNTPITLRQLMSHTAGLRDDTFYTRALEGDVKPLDELFTTEDAKDVFFYRRPGGKMTYSNFGGGLLGVLIETVTGRAVDDYMEDTFFAPLDITAAYRSSLLPEDVTVSDIYEMPSGTLSDSVREDAGETASPDPMLDYTLTAGKLTISAPDLAKLLIVLCDNGVYGDTCVLSETSAAAMRTPQNNIGTVTCESGWGLNMSILTDTLVEGRTLYGHGGKASGMLCAAYFDESDRTGVVMLTNGCNNLPETNGIGTLSLLTIRLCYSELIDGRHVTQNPWLVGE